MREKKFASERDNAPEVFIDMKISLPDYLMKFRPEIFKQKSYMDKEAISFWSWLFGNPVAYEEKRPGRKAVIWPYADRLMYLATKFDSLEDREKDYIKRCRKANIFWRGDDINDFRKIVDETILFRRLTDEGKEDYRKKTLSMAMAMVK